MRILGIDPGLADTGWAVLESEDGREPRLTAWGLVDTPAAMPLPLRLRKLHEAVLGLLDEHNPSAAALEMMFFARSAKSVAGTLQARGVILLACERGGVEVCEYNPSAVKTSLTGNGAAPKPQMQKMVQMLLKLPAPLHPDHIADAAAIGLCHLRTQRFLARVRAS